MKSIKEKQLLVKWSQAMNEPIDAAIVEEVERYERIKQDILISVKLPLNCVKPVVATRSVAMNIVLVSVKLPVDVPFAYI